MRPQLFWIAVPILAGLLIAFALTGGTTCFECLTFQHHHHGSVERPASTCLKTITSAQADFRVHDRDGDRKANFWRADIAGLYALAPGGGPAIKLIELSIAAADDRPIADIRHYAVPSTKAGYWFRAIRHDDEDPKALDPDRFAVCAYPDSPSAGKYLYICDENCTIYRSPANGRRGIEVYPTDAELKQSWTKLD